MKTHWKTDLEHITIFPHDGRTENTVEITNEDHSETYCYAVPEYAERICEAVNAHSAPKINPFDPGAPTKPGALDYHVDYLFEIATANAKAALTRQHCEASRQAILAGLAKLDAPAPQHPAVIALANLLGEVEKMANEENGGECEIDPGVYREALAVIASNMTE